MDAKEDSYFVLELLDFVLQITGKPLPCHLQRKIDMYALKEDSWFTKNIRKAIMINLNDHLSTKEAREDDASKIYEAKMRGLWKEYTVRAFLKFLSQFAYESILDLDNKADAIETFLRSVMFFIKNLRDKERFDNMSWRVMDQHAVSLVMEDRENRNYRILRKCDLEPGLTSEKGYVLLAMYYVFDFSCKVLPPYLQIELDRHDMSPDSKLKNVVFVILTDLAKKTKLIGEIEPIVMYYYNLCSKHFNEKYFLEFCVCCTKKAMIEYFNESREQAPMNAYELAIYMLQLAKEDGKYTSLEAVDEAASKLLEEDRNRIEHERKRREVSVDLSSESALQATESEILLESNQAERGCSSRCCTLH